MIRICLFHSENIKEISVSTISRWIKIVLTESGIDVNKFSVHRTRHTSTSVARQRGVSIDEIKKKKNNNKNGWLDWQS